MRPPPTSGLYRWCSHLGPTTVGVALTLNLVAGLFASCCFSADRDGRTNVVFETKLGSICIEIDRSAAPQTIARWLRLVEGPVFDPDLVDEAASSLGMGYYDGMAFSYTKPHIEVVTAGRPPLEAFQLQTEIDAEALGLHEQWIEDNGEAMNVLQHELMKTYGRLGKGDHCTPLLLEWVDAWH